ncbi:MAG: SRPBCC family protein [Myxococcales bacterium]|nr:SRPBCC family protein [Myxococcales bacterium]
MGIQQRRTQTQGATGFRRMLLLVAASVALLLTAATAQAEGPSGSIDVSAPAELAWQVLTDFAAWPRFMPSIHRVAVRELGASELKLRHETETMGFQVEFTALTEVDSDALRLHLRLDESEPADLAAMDATWQVVPLAAGGARIEFRSDVRSGAVPAFVERRMVKKSVDETVEAVAAEIQRRLDSMTALAAASAQGA